MADGLLRRLLPLQAQQALFDVRDDGGGAGYDELVDASGDVRPAWRELAEGVGERGRDGLDRLRAVVRGARRQRRHHLHPGGPPRGKWSPTATGPRCPVPGVSMPCRWSSRHRDWDGLESGLVQRSRLLDAVLGDLHGARRSITSGVLPAELLFAHPGYLRAARGIVGARASSAVPARLRHQPRRRRRIRRQRGLDAGAVGRRLCPGGPTGHRPCGA